jgi:hypothetical protein
LAEQHASAGAAYNTEGTIPNWLAALRYMRWLGRAFGNETRRKAWAVETAITTAWINEISPIGQTG